MRTPPDRSRQHREFSRRPLIEQVKDLFSLHTSERRGIAAMVVLLFAGFVIVVYVQWFRPPAAHDKQALRTEMMAWLAKRDSANAAAEALARSGSELFRFDPNVIDEAAWLRLGLSERQASSIMRFRAKGGRFRTKADLGRMYALRPEQIAELTPYVLLPDSLPSRDSRIKARWSKENDHSPKQNESTAAAQANYPAKAKPQRQLVEVNTADTTELIALPGIGPAFARGIVKYRESLGGYFSLDQLAEVYVLKDKPDAVVRLKELLVLDTLVIRRIPLNSCTVEQLAAHPYARWRIAKPVIAYRQQHGPFKRIDDIRVIPVIDEEGFRKLAPYLTLE